LKREKLLLADLIQHTLAIVNTETQKKQIQIITENADDLPMLEADSDKVKQVLLNIFLNSLAAMNNSGKLSVKTVTGNNYIKVIISDTGVGIDESNLPSIYDPYFTSKPAGTGLGLAVVQKIMEAHGGKIDVQSVLGQGTDVILQFPLFHIQNRG
jgi:signal transduction histidine kinase